MATPDSTPPSPAPAGLGLRIIGTGTAGVALLKELHPDGGLNARFIAVDGPPTTGSDFERIEINRNLLGGRGSHASEPGQVELETQVQAVSAACAGCDTVFVLAGLGGRAGSWLSLAVARAARAAGAQVFAFVTLPFDCEGSVRFSHARQALERLKPHCDFLFVQPHQDHCAQHDEKLNLTEVYAPANRRLAAAVRHVAAALAGSTILGMGFGDLCAMLRDRGAAVQFAVGVSAGTDRAGAVLEELLAHPRLEGGRRLAEAETVAVSLVGGQDFRMADVNRIMSQLGEHWQGTSHLLSACVGPAPEAPLGAMLLIVTLEAARTASRLTATVSGTKAVSESSAFGTHLLARPDEAGTSSRFNVLSGDSDRAPAPRLRGGRTRKEAARLRQGQLDLDLINKGRFEKSEPTIHKGEDLDVPTFIRRGIVLN